MKRTLPFCVFTLLLIGFFASSINAQTHSQPTISEKTSDMEKHEGFFNFWWDDEAGKIWLEVDKLNQEFIYVNSLAAGSDFRSLSKLF